MRALITEKQIRTRQASAGLDHRGVLFLYGWTLCLYTKNLNILQGYLMSGKENMLSFL